MPLWVLEPKSDEKVPGTVYVGRETEASAAKTAHLKTGTGRHEGIILVPQPSNSPNDPLNWPEREKLFHSWFLAIGSGLSSGTSFFLNPSHKKMSVEIGTSITQLSRSISFLMLALGIASITTTPLARMYGKRPVFIGLGIIGIIGYSVLLSNPHDMRYIYAGRFFWGACVSGLQYLVSSSVGDLFFVHQRGFHLALWHFGLSGGNALGQVIASQVVQGQGYVWAFRYAVIFMSAYIFLLFLLIPETTYNRPKRFDTDIREILADDSDQDASQTKPPAPLLVGDDEKSARAASTAASDEDPEARAPEKRKTWLQGLKIYNGRFSHENYFRGILSPFVTLALPAVHWAAYAYGLTVAFAAAISVCLAQIFSVPPYNFGPGAIGLMTLSPFVGNIIGNFIPGPVADWLVTYMSRKNGGVYEPEFRNILCLPALFAGAAGFWGFGLSIHFRTHWFLPVFFFGLSAFAGAIMSLVSNTYLLDCHRRYAQDAYAAVGFVKAIASFAISFFVNDWLTRHGPINVFFVIGSIHVIGCLYGLFLYVYGKRIRLAIHKSERIQNLLRTCGNTD
ncbi:major facilitator superfamily domain-containing protein [Plectosphaerella plurivora]|uniref:Major facilitator superfamily domain-containing protein n=1 Tax=Plectosphaerella plurivora TaxID=936078 RepID=A0A9P9A618_9PEZI|nr:major facilitator superfamily domain-containing protein [Plectosphaerella plurivora]